MKSRDKKIQDKFYKHQNSKDWKRLAFDSQRWIVPDIS